MDKLILIADDETSIINGLSSLLEDEGYSCCSASDGEEALSIYNERHPSLVILDIMMPKKNGFDVCEAIRATDRETPILLLSAKNDIVDKSIGFKVGADDYVTKPFVKEELLLRVGALIRRSSNWASGDIPRGKRSVVRIDELEIHFRRHKVYLRGQPIDLTPKEFMILALLANHAGEVFTTQEIIEYVWGKEYYGELTSVAVFIRKIREKIEDDPSKPRYLITVWRVGYRLGN
jgi:two-component system response regulator VicR